MKQGVLHLHQPLPQTRDTDLTYLTTLVPFPNTSLQMYSALELLISMYSELDM